MKDDRPDDDGQRKYREEDDDEGCRLNVFTECLERLQGLQFQTLFV